jgi:hypothetical protein
MAAVPLESIRGRRKIAVDGYQFVFDRQSSNGSTNFWRCELKMSGCPVRIHTDATDNVIKRMHDHNHGSNAAGIEVSRVRTAVKRRAENTVEVCIINEFHIITVEPEM